MVLLRDTRHALLPRVSINKKVSIFWILIPFVAKLVTVKLLLALAAQRSWPLIQLDVNNAFLNGSLDEEVYMKLPQGYSCHSVSSNGKPFVCKLEKSLYGLRQASRQWYATFSSFLLSQGFTQSKADYSLFYKGKGSSYVALLVYVDDIVLTGASLHEIDSIKQSLSNKFKLKDLGKLQHFLGLEIARSTDGIYISLTTICSQSPRRNWHVSCQTSPLSNGSCM